MESSYMKIHGLDLIAWNKKEIGGFEMKMEEMGGKREESS